MIWIFETTESLRHRGGVDDEWGEGGMEEEIDKKKK